MDVESLAKELILKNMTPEQQIAVLDSVKASVAQAREVQKRKIGENVDIVVQALKTIEADIRSRFDDVGNAIEKRVASIQDGRDGADGKDGRDGKDGKNGRDGTKGDRGERGQDGRDGIDGVDGVSVTNAHIDFDGSLIITLSSGIELNVGEVVAPDLAESIKVITNGGGTSQLVLDTLTSLQSQITNLIPSQTGNSGKYLTTNGTALSWASIAGGGLSYQGTWNASTNTPTLASSTGTNGYYYIVSTAGSTNLNGITDWQIGDWLLFNGTVWQKLDQTNLVTSVAGKTGAVVLNNTDVSGFASIAAAGGTTVLTVSSAPNYVVTGSGGQTIQLPDATTLQNGAIFSFNNNQSSGTIIVKNNSSTTVSTVQSGGYVSLVLLSNSLAAGSWDVHNYAPSNVSWSTNTFDYAGSITSATWNGNAVAYNRGGTGQSSAFVAGGIVYGSTTSALAVTAIGTTGQVLTSAGAGTPTWTTPTTGTVTSVTGTSPISSSGGNTPAISLEASYGDTQNPYASKTAKYVLAAPNGADGVPTFRAIVASDIPTLNQNTTGSAATLTTARAIYGNNFDGSAALTQVIASTYGGTGNGFTKFTGATTSEKTYTLPDASSTIVVQGGALGTPSSGTLTNCTFPTLNQNTTGSAATVTTTINSGVVATTQTAGDNSTKVATTAYVNAVTGTSGITGFKNRIINGAMVIDQRNAGASGTTANAYTVDRWQYIANISAKGTYQQNAGSVTPPAGFSNYLGFTSSSAYSVATSDTFAFSQNIEGFNFADMAWGTASAATVTLSFWVYSSLTGTFGGALKNSASSRSYPFTYTISSASTWEQKTVTIAGDTSGTWIGATNGIGVSVLFGLGVGSTYSGTAGAWAGTQYLSATGATSVVGTNGATFYITGVQLEKSSIATSFDYRSYGTELNLCQRYFEKIQPDSAYQMLASGFVTATTNGAFCLLYNKKRTSPSFTFTAGSTFAINNGADTATNVTAIAINAGRIGTQSANVHATVASGLTVGNGCLLNANSTAANCSISISAEL
jgi:hypothetical protein